MTDYPTEPRDPFAPPPSYDPWLTQPTLATQPSDAPEATEATGAAEAAQETDVAPAPPDAPFDTLGRPLHERRGPRTGALLTGALVIALVAGGVGGGLGAWLANRDSGTNLDSGASLGAVPQGTLSRPPESVAGIAQRVLPTVVSIQVQSGATGDTGSGFILRSDGYILTNNHVVAAAASGGRIDVQFNDGSMSTAKIVGRSPSYDLAVLKVSRSGLPVAVLGDSDSVVVGDETIAIGSPLGLAGTVTSGIVSAKNRPVTTGEGDGTDLSYLSAIQTDAAINPGNSGGPLVDGQGRVIGINSAIATLSGGSSGQSGSIGVGFSIPINQARRVAEQIIRTGFATYPIIGASLDQAFNGAGVRIRAVTAGGPAARAGLQAGDIVMKADGDPLTLPEELIVAIRTKQPGEVIRLDYVRGGSKAEAVVVLGSTRG
jgi:putative serine protease PepD